MPEMGLSNIVGKIKTHDPFMEKDEQELFMSKYIYTTIYEQFTGLKPPEPKDHKPRRRRGYGHPYRMRLNMQESNDQSNEHLPSGHEQDIDYFEQSQVSAFQPSVKQQSVRKFSGSQGYQNNGSGGGSYRSAVSNDFPSNTETKVTYKKRRQYGSSFGVNTMSRDTNENADY